MLFMAHDLFHVTKVQDLNFQWPFLLLLMWWDDHTKNSVKRTVIMYFGYFFNSWKPKKIVLLHLLNLNVRKIVIKKTYVFMTLLRHKIKRRSDYFKSFFYSWQICLRSVLTIYCLNLKRFHFYYRHKYICLSTRNV